MLLDIYTRKSLLQKLRSTLSGYSHLEVITSPTPTSLLSPTIQSHPLLQSIYAESLRLRTSVFSPRYTGDSPLLLSGKWLIPARTLVFAANMTAHLNKSFWERRPAARPVEEFWAERFLSPSPPPGGSPAGGSPEGGPPGESTTTPQSASGILSDASAAEDSAKGDMVFSLPPRGQYYPYGGAPHVCPGRFLAKRIMLSVTALFVNRFDIEITASERATEMDPQFAGLGGQKPRGAIAFRIRQRQD